jgi:hypothetical protein
MSIVYNFVLFLSAAASGLFFRQDSSKSLQTRKIIYFLVGRDFSKHPKGVTLKDGPYSGEAFHQIIETMIDSEHNYELYLDDVEQYDDDFLKAAFSNHDVKKNKIKFISNNSELLEKINRFWR